MIPNFIPKWKDDGSKIQGWWAHIDYEEKEMNLVEYFPTLKSAEEWVVFRSGDVHTRTINDAALESLSEAIGEFSPTNSIAMNKYPNIILSL